MADMAIRLAKEPRPSPDISRGEFLLGRQNVNEAPAFADIETPRTVAIEPTLDMPAPADAESRI
jgi:hypothetical protein